MSNDLLGRITQTFEKRLKNVNIKAASYEDVNDYAVALGEILTTAFNIHITENPGEIIEQILNDRLKENHRLITDFGRLVQDILNKQAKIGLEVQIPEVNQSRIDGLVSRLSEGDFEQSKWLLGSPVVNFSQSVVDDMVRKNAEFHFHSGMSPKIVRKEVGNCCKWCKSLVGTYSYPDVPKDVYRRHRNCRCTVEYYPGKGKKQNVHSKGWSKTKISDKITIDKYNGNSVIIQAGAKYYHRDDTYDFLLSEKGKKREIHAYLTYEKIKNSDQEKEKRKIYSNISKFKEMEKFTKKDVDIAFDHVFNNIHNLKEGRMLFRPEPDMARSWERLIIGKNIQQHDLILLKHERLEHDYMYVTNNLDYDSAHALTDKKYNYARAVEKYNKRNEGK